MGNIHNDIYNDIYIIENNTYVPIKDQKLITLCLDTSHLVLYPIKVSRKERVFSNPLRTPFVFQLLSEKVTGKYFKVWARNKLSLVA